MAASPASLRVAPFFRFANLGAQPGLLHAITIRWRPRADQHQGNGSTNIAAHSDALALTAGLLDYGEARPLPASPIGGGVFTPLPAGRAGGGSTDFNLGYRATNYDPRQTAANWRYLTAGLGIEPERIVAARQVHGGRVVVVDEAEGGAGIRLQAWGPDSEWRDDEGPRKPPVTEADGLCANQRRVWLMNVYADCTPLLFYDPRQRVAAVAHAGWRGTVAQIGAEAVRVMGAAFGTRPADLLCGIGPAAGPCCYQVSEEVIAAVQAAFPQHPELLDFTDQPPNHAILDLWAANHVTLEEAGVLPANIETAAICTIHRHDLFFSARADGAEQAGRRFAAIIGLL